ncbi:MAG: ATP-binding protein [Fibromonadaceae bacterium]|jgi:AAA+ ATPase superfamily predicted ATPase|nr:ATP-binding protein [Fibromonadaceae bacterium]
MDTKPKNPFLISGYHSPAYFCDRIAETEQIISALQSGRNISLISPRRIGKTGLIHNVFYRLKEKDKNSNCFYIDIFATQNLLEFTNLLGKAVIGQLEGKPQNAIKKIASFFKSFRPLFSFDSQTGMPTVSLDIKYEQAQSSLQEIFSYLKKSAKTIYIAIDEFQQIMDYPEKGIEALLRSYLQFLPNVHFIFSGSKKHLMDAMFSSANRPFYQSTQKIGLREIEIESYRKFAIKLFSEHKKKLPTNVFDFVYENLQGHTWYVQLILNLLFAMDRTNYSEQNAKDAINGILQEENATYKTYCEMITKGQLCLLRAIAREHSVKSPYEQSFMQKHGLKAASSVKLALKSLMDKTLILKDENGYYYVYDRFFSLWLRG